MNFIKFTILTIIIFTSACTQITTTEKPELIVLTERMDKQTIKKRFF